MKNTIFIIAAMLALTCGYATAEQPAGVNAAMTALGSADERTVYEASDAVVSLSGDPATLSRLRSAARLSPAVAAYADMRAANRLDTAFACETAAARALAGIARGMAPSVRARTLYNLANVYGTMADKRCLDAIGEAVSCARADKSAGAEARLVLYELTRLYLLRNHFEGDNPMRFAEIFNLEKRALAVYSALPDSRDKADVYQMLAQMKANTDFVDDFKQATDSVLFNDSSTDFSQYRTLVGNGINTNSAYYGNEAFNMYVRMLGKDNADVIFPWLNYLISRLGDDDVPWLTASADSVAVLAEKYFAEGHPALVEARFYRDYIASVVGQPLRFAGGYIQDLRRYASFFGKESPSYLTLTEVYAMNLAQSGNDNTLPEEFYGVEEEYNTIARRVYRDDAGRYLSGLYTLLQVLELCNPDLFVQRLDEAVAILTDTVTPPSWSLVSAGRKIAKWKFDNGSSVEAVNIVIRLIKDLAVLTGNRLIPASGELMLDLSAYMQNSVGTPEQVMRQYEATIAVYGATGIVPVMPLLNYSIFLNNMGYYEEAIKQLNTLMNLDYLKDLPVDRAYTAMFIGEVMYNAGNADKDSLRAIFERAAPILTADTAVVNTETVRGYLFLSHYYQYIERYDLALATLEKGWALMDGMCSVTDIVRNDFNNELFAMYMFVGNDRKAEDFNERCISDLEAAGFQESYQYLEYMWNRYIIANWRTPGDVIKLYPILIGQMPYIMTLYKRTGESPDVLYNFFVRVLSAALELITYGKTMIDNMETYGNSGILGDDYVKTKAFIDGNVKQCKEQFMPFIKKIEAGFPDYAKPYDYRLQPSYLTLISSLKNWYGYVMKDSVEKFRYVMLISDVYKVQGKPWLGDEMMADYYFSVNDYKTAYIYSSSCYTNLGYFNSFQQLQIGRDYFSFSNYLGHYDKAVTAALEHAERMRNYVLGSFDYMSSAERAEFISAYGYSSDVVNAVLDRRPDELSAPAYDAALFDKGLLLHSWERLRRSILRSGDKSLIASLDTLDLLKRKTGMIKINPRDNEQGMQMANLRADVDRLEKKLARRTAQFRTDTMRVVTWNEVQARLKEGEAAVEFVFADSALAALVLRPGYDMPRYVRLCNARECYDMLAEVEDFPAMTRVRRLYSYGRSRLYELLWRPLEGCLSGVSTVYYSPTAFLHRVAFDAIPVTADSCLTDRYDLRYVSTTANLLRHGRHKEPASAAVFGGIYYSPDQEPQSGDGRERSARAAVTDAFPYLEQTKVEADTISGLVERSGLSLERYAGARGTEPNFYSLDGRSPDIIHLATHGFYIKEKDVADNAFLANHPGDRYSSMQRTGLTFCGANATWTGERRADRADGVMTAAELSLLDLGRTDLVVLSACETALGDYSLEGVYGLQRGFKEAGVNTLIMSLWNVNDRAASEFMQDFYRRWLGGQPKHEAFRAAMASLRAVRPDPFFWAAFVMLDAD